MAAIYTLVASGQNVSAAFAVDRPNRMLLVTVPSLSTGQAVIPQFTTISGTAPFYSLQRVDGSGLPWTVYSGAGPAMGLVPYPPTQWGRISITASVTAPTTFTLTTYGKATL